MHSLSMWTVAIVLFGSFFFVNAVFEVYYELEDQYQEMLKGLDPPPDPAKAYKGLDPGWVCPQNANKSYKVDEIMAQLKDMLEDGRFMEFRDACLRCAELSTRTGQANPLASRTVVLGATTVDSFVAALREVIEPIRISIETPHRLTYEILQAYLMLHPKMYEAPARLVVALLNDFKPEPPSSSASSQDEEVLSTMSQEIALYEEYPVLRSLLRVPLYRRSLNQWRAWYEQAFPFPRAKEIIDVILLRTRTVEFLSTAHKAESIASKKVDFETMACPIDQSFTEQDRQRFLRYLISEEDFLAEDNGYRLLVLQNYLQVSAVKEAEPSTSPSEATAASTRSGANARPAAKRDQLHPTVKDPDRMLFLKSADRFPEQFEAFLSIIGDPLFEPTESFLQFALSPPSSQTSPPSLVCHYLRERNNEPSSKQEAIDNLSRLLLTLTFMRNLTHAQRIYKQTVAGCKLFAKGSQGEIVLEASKFPERSEAVRFLLGRSFFNHDRIIMAQEADALLSLINDDRLAMDPVTKKLRELFTPDKDKYGEYEVTTVGSDGTSVTSMEAKAAIHLLFRAPLQMEELSDFLAAILTKYTARLDELKARDAKEKTTEGQKWENRAAAIFKLFLTETPLKDLLPKVDYFYEWLEEILRREAYGPFKGLCTGPQCNELPMKMITRFWEQALVLIDQREAATSPTDRAAIGKELIELQEAYLLYMENLTKMLRRLYVVTYKDDVGMAPPGLLDRKQLADNFASMDYVRALSYLKQRDMWPMRQSLIPWYGTTLIGKASENPELMSHLVMGALHEHRLHTLKELLHSEDPSPAFRHTEGFRFYLLYLLYQVAHANRGSDLPADQKSIPLLHVRLMLTVNGELTNLQKTYETMLAKMEEAAKGGADERPESAEAWGALQEKYRSGLYEPSAPPPARPPLQGPVETILNEACLGPPDQAPWCPFSKRDPKGPLFSLDAYVASTRVPEPTLGQPPHDGYVMEFILWFVRLCRDEMAYRQASKVKSPAEAGAQRVGGALASRQGASGRGLGGTSNVAATTATLPPDSQLKVFFEIIIIEASRYLMLNPDEAALTPIWLYASQALRSGA